MLTAKSSKQCYVKRTRRVFMLTEIFSEPLLVMYGLLAFVIRKDLGASSMQISVLATLKPLVALFSLYWSYSISERKDCLRDNVFWAGFLGRLPFLFFFFIRDPWIIIIAAAFFMLLKRGGMPAWMEIIKLNLPEDKRGSTFSLGSAMAYIEGIFLSVFVGGLLDRDGEWWRWLFPATALLGMIAVFQQRKLPINGVAVDQTLPVKLKDGRGLYRRLLAPWKMAYSLIKCRPDFAHFQVGFMICGSALMLIMSAIPIFCIDYLNVSYMDLAIAIGVFRGLGFACSAFYWPKILKRINIFNTVAIICVLFALFPITIIVSQWHINCFYLAYLIYGVAQGGSHLCWNMSGPIFSQDENSSVYSSVNILMVGVRGCIAPIIGGALVYVWSPVYVLYISVLLSVVAALYFIFSSYRKEKFC